jgi:hypothetical protein
MATSDSAQMPGGAIIPGMARLTGGLPKSQFSRDMAPFSGYLMASRRARR